SGFIMHCAQVGEKTLDNFIIKFYSISSLEDIKVIHSMNKKLLMGILILLGLGSCTIDTAEVKQLFIDQMLEEELLSVSDGKGLAYFILPDSDDYANIPQDEKNEISYSKVYLGRLLFHETGLGINPKLEVGMGTYSCASCHHAGAGFQASRKQGIGDGGMGFGLNGEGRTMHPDYEENQLDVQPIRSPSALNVAYQKLMLWNGQFGATDQNIGTEAQWTENTPKAINKLGYEGVETQAIAGLGVHRIIINDSIIEALGYKHLFDHAFGDFPDHSRYSTETAGLAIAAYERTLLANQAPFQQWLKGNTLAMSEEQKSGALLFFGKAKCGTCHQGPALNDMNFYAFGMKDLEGEDVHGVTEAGLTEAAMGRGGFTKVNTDMYKFKTPQLYNLADSPFYGHGGSFQSVRAVVDYKNKGIAENADVPNAKLDPYFVPLGLSDEEVDAITSFIREGLYDPYLVRFIPESLFSEQCFPNNDMQSKIDLNCQ
ncbi:MAG: cytochrome c peroxidase, partial [Bacteroidota bacterium]